MTLSTISIKRPVLAIVMNLVIMIFGVIGFNYLGVREFPSVDPPIVNVSTSYPGANADIIESQITEPLEKALNSVEGIRTVTSSSNQGRSNITVEFHLGVDMERATNDVRDKVSAAGFQLPRDIDGNPIVRKADADAQSIMAFTLSGDNRNILEMSDFAENVIAPRLETIEGVSEVRVWGMKKYSMRIWMDPAKMAALGVTTQDIRSALDRENVELPSGKLQGSATEMVVKTIGRFSTEEDFNNMIVKNTGEIIVRMKDVGYAELGAENLETVMRLNGVPMNGIAIQPQPGANYLSIAEEAYTRKAEIEKTLPDDIKLGVMFDNTRFIKSSVEEVAETIVIAIVLVIIIIFLFFRDWIVAVRPLLDIPVSLTGTFFIMYLLGFSINVLTLLAVVLATGLVVDDGIVVTENIYKKIEAGMNPIEAAIKGSNEIIFAVLSTSITLAAVFLPVIFMEGFVGKLFMEFGVVLASAVLISAFVSLTLTPMLNAYLIRKNHKPTKFYTMTEPYFQKMELGYKDSLVSFLKKKWLVYPILAVVLVMAWFFGTQLKSELAPLDDRSSLSLSFQGPEGLSFDAMDEYIQSISQVIRDSVPEVEGVMAITSPSFGGSGGANSGFGQVMLKDKSERDRSQDEIANQITDLTRKYTVGRTFVNQQQTISVGRRGGLPVGYVLQTPDLDKMREYLPRFLALVDEDPTFTMSNVDLKFTKLELTVHIDREKSKSLGVTVADVAQTMNLAFSGQRFNYFNMNGRQYQVIGQFQKPDRNAPIDLKSLYVKNNMGELVQLDNIVTLVEHSSPPTLYHYDRYMSATVSAGLAPGYTIADGIVAMDKIRDQIDDSTVRTALTGSSRDYAESSSNTLFSFGLALILVFLVLAAQFESFVDPFIIMITVPLAVAGAFFALWLFDQTLNIFSQIGMIMLIGLVTKNGILIVEFANQLREKGIEKAEAALEASVLRLRPILMTTLATAFGALPIALALGAAGTSRRAMGIVVIGGVIFSLILTLYVIPTMYIYMSGKKNFDRMKAIDKIAEEA